MKKFICLLLALLFILGLVGCNRDEVVEDTNSDESSVSEISDEQKMHTLILLKISSEPLLQLELMRKIILSKQALILRVISMRFMIITAIY